MIKPLYCIIDHQSGQTREKQRETAIRSLELEQDKTIPIFEEATQTAASLLKVPICAIGILLGNDYLIKSAYGLSSLGLSSEIVRTRKINREDSFAVYVVDSSNCLMLENTGVDYFFSRSILSQHYHIMSYLGVPIALNNGQCIGCLEVFDLQPRQFSQSDIDILNIVARWCLAEYEHNYSEIKQKVVDNSSLEDQNDLYFPSIPVSSANQLNLPAPVNNSNQTASASNNENQIYNQQLSIQLVTKLIQKLSIPLTSVIGMSSVLKQGIYGKLNQKQQEYLNIVYNSGQEMTTLVEEITNLGNFKPEVELQLVPVDLENLGKQVISSLENAARNREHTLRLSIEPGEKVWQLDREKVKQSLYYILTAIIEGSRSGGEISIHISQRSQTLKINCWVRHPWLGDGISFEKINNYTQAIQEAQESYRLSQGKIEPALVNDNYDYDVICLLFACYLTYLQKGSISLKGSSEAGYRFLLSLPIA